MEGFQTVLAQSAPGTWELIVMLALIVGFILLVRLFGAWMLRINEVIDLLISIRNLLKKSLDDKAENEHPSD